MARFEVKYTDPETGEEVTEEKEFFASVCVAEDTRSIVRRVDISAMEWAEDYAYSRADKGSHSVRRVS